MKIIIDADACPKPVLQICLELGREYRLEVWTVASFNHRIDSDRHITVGNSPQEADIKVINLTAAGDIVVTQDWGLAAMVLGRNAKSISPAGREYQPGNIDFLLEEREIKAKLRRGGGKTKGPKKRSAADDDKFRQGLKRLITEKSKAVQKYSDARHGRGSERRQYSGGTASELPEA